MARSALQTVSGVRKAAVVLASLPQDVAGAVLSMLGRDEAEAVSLEIARLGDIEESRAEEIIAEFVGAARAGGPVLREGVERARALLREALPREEAERAVSRLEESLGRRPFDFLLGAKPEAILVHLRDEGPQTIAVVLANLPAAKAGRVLAGLSTRVQGEVVRRIARLRDASPEAVRTVEEALLARIGESPAAPVLGGGGAEHVAEIIRRAGRSVELTAFDALEDEEPDLAADIRKRLFAFEDLLGADDRGVRALLKEVSTQELSVALKTASEELREKFFANLSNRARALLQEEMEYMRPVRLSEVEAAQARILEAARRLEETGDLFVAGRASGEDYVV
jgi:flagellar motor switch protein FliG